MYTQVTRMGRPKKNPPPVDPIEAVAERLTAEVSRVSPIHDSDWLSSGNVILNLAASGHLDRFIPKGHYVYFVGDSSSGKTFWVLNLLAEAARNIAFKKHRFVFDNAENGALMDTTKFFGKAVTDRIESPGCDNSRTIQEFFYHLDSALSRGPCIYILDSIDALNSLEDETKFEEEKAAWEKSKDVTGSYAMSKPKYISRNLNRVVMKLRDTGSVLALISQTRDKVGGVIPGQKTRSGGRALKSFAHLELWTSVRGPITKTVLGKEREIGSKILIDIQKNRLSGWEGKLQIPFHRSHGFDDTGAMCDFLTDEHWESATVKGKGTIIKASEFDFEGNREQLISHIESCGGESKLCDLATQVWQAIEDACAVKRKSRYQ